MGHHDAREGIGLPGRTFRIWSQDNWHPEKSHRVSEVHQRAKGREVSKSLILSPLANFPTNLVVAAISFAIPESKVHLDELHEDIRLHKIDFLRERLILLAILKVRSG